MFVWWPESLFNFQVQSVAFVSPVSVKSPSPFKSTFFWTLIEPYIILVNVQVTFSPAESLILAFLFVISPVESPDGSLQDKLVSAQSEFEFSVTVYSPGKRSVNVFVSFPDVDPSSVNEKVVGKLVPVVANPKEYELVGWASLIIVILPFLVLVIVQYLVSPAATFILVQSLLVKLHPAGTVSDTEYVPGVTS